MAQTRTKFGFGTDARLLINSWDESAAGFTGRASVDALGKKYYAVFPRILRDNKDAVISVLKDGSPLAIKGHYFNCLSGRVKADISIAPVRNGGGEVSGARVEISASPPLQHDNLRHTQQLIDVGRIATTFAHSVRNPLNAIKGAVVYLNSRYSGEKTLIEFTNIIEDEISRLDDFISRFLSSYVSETEIKDTDLNAILRKIELFTSLQAHSRGIEPVYEYGDIPPVFINPFQMEQAILNVVNNAIEAIGNGGALTVKTSLDDQLEGRYIVVGVSDTGQGISPSLPEAMSPPSKKNKGRGFGLFITCEILKQYGGRLEIKSREGGKGTTVRLILPATEDGGRVENAFL